MKRVAGLWSPFENVLRDAAQVFAVVAAVLVNSARPDTWRRTLRAALARQILHCGVEAIGFASVVAVIVGVLIVVQVQLWLVRVGQTALLGPVLVTVVIRELGPLLANLIVIGRSGTAVAAELANMRIGGEVRVLDAQGLDPLPFLVIPRALAFTISVFCLSIIFILFSLASGYCFGAIANLKVGGIGVFVDSIVHSIGPADVSNLIAKTLTPGLFSGTICCIEGLRAAESVTDVPEAASRAVQRSGMWVFLIFAVVSLITYL